MPPLPSHAHYVVIGAGIHGLSTSMHLAQKLKAQGKTIGASGTRIVVLEKTGIGAGPSGIACGVVRNNYFQPAMRELMAHSVSVWESRPEGIQLSPGRLHANQPGSDARASRNDLRAAESDRLRVCVRRRRSGIDAIHEGDVPRLAGAKHHVGTARKARRLREQHGFVARPRPESQGTRRRNPRGRGSQGAALRQWNVGDLGGRDYRRLNCLRSS